MSTPSLIQWIQGLISQGQANGWASFGQSNSSYGVPAAGTEKGQDIGLAPGTPIPGMAGIVTAITNWGYGDYAATIKDALGNLITVGHIHPSVKVGQSISPGQFIGYSAGYPSPISSGPHIEIRVQPNGGSFTNPITWLQSLGAQTTQTLGVGIPGFSEPAYPTSTGPGGTSNPQVAQAQTLYAASQGATPPDLPPITIDTPFGPVNIPNPFGGLARIFWVIAGAIVIIVGLWVMVQGSRE